MAPPARPVVRKRILVLGGTGFAGPPIVREALARGHAVTLFNRGKSHPGLFPDVETILGDRQTQLDLLSGRDWDVVIDTWAPGPTLVRRAAELLRERVGHYIFLSTISVYKLGREALDETSATLPLPPGVEIGKPAASMPVEAYGPLKALAEQAAEAAMPGRSTSVRSGVIAGPGDPTDRFTYWPLRLTQGAEMIAPGPRDNRMQFIDVRDLGASIVTVAEQGHMGVYNAVGPDDATLGAVLDGVRAGVGGAATMTWVDEHWLKAHDAAGWGSFPLVVAGSDDEAGFGHVSAARAIARGLRFRMVADTARDTLAWWNEQPEERRAKKRPGITPEREADLLKRWHEGGG
jgi:2'-hydroxyisoflavone reductase